MAACSGTRRITFPNKRPVFYYITDRKQLPGLDCLTSVRHAISWGVDFIQIREKDVDDRTLYKLASAAVRYAAGTDSRILVNSRADVAIAAGAAGVHLPSSGLGIRALKTWLPRRLLLGISAHSIKEALIAARDGADYILLGPVFPTPSKMDYGPPIGLETLRQAAARVPVPVIGLGGIQAPLITPVLQAGAVGVAGIRLFQANLHSLGSKRSWAMSSRPDRPPKRHEND